MIDPFDFLDPTGNGNYPRPPQQQPIRPLAPEEEESLLARVGGHALGGLGYVGSVLEKTFGGRAIRGALGGKPRELLSVLPFSDTLGITDEKDRVSGKELLGLGHDDSWGATLGGLGAEVLLDPSTYLSLGTGAALTASGKAASKAGTLAPTALARVQQGQSGLLGLGLPFRSPSVLLGTGATGEKVLQGAQAAGKAIDAGARAVPLLGHAWDTAGKAIDFTRRYGNALFDPSVMGATSHLGQEVAREATQATGKRISDLRGFVGQSLQDLKAGGASETGGELRSLLEGIAPTAGAPTAADAGVAQAARARLDQQLAEAQGLGLDLNAWTDPVAQYAPRQTGTPLQRGLTGQGGRPVQPFSGHDPRLVGRDPIFGGVKGGTEEGLNRLATDPAVYAGTPLTAAAHVRANYLHDPAAPEAADQALRLVDYLRSRAPGGGAPERLFPNHPLADMLTQGERMSRLMGAAEAAHGLLARTAIDTRAGGVVPQGARRLLDVLKDSGLGTQTLNAPNGGLSQQAGRLSKLLGAPVSETDLVHFMVPEQTAGELGRYLRGFSHPESLSPILGAYDAITNLTKLGQTALWPSFHVRNLVSGLWQNFVKGGLEPGHDPMTGLLKPWMDARRLLGGEVLADAHLLPGMAPGMTAEDATRQLGREMYQFGIGGHGSGHRQLAGPGGQAQALAPGLSDLLMDVPGSVPQTFGGALGKLATREPGAWSPLNTAGVGTNADVFAPARAGRGVGDMIEGANRGGLYLALRKQGFAPEEAARQVIEAHFDYGRGAMTDFEARVMKRLVPFYTYARKNIPYQLEQLAAHPGGAAGLEARAAHDFRQDGGFLPDYLGNGLAVPLGAENAQGMRRYLTRLDLPPEQAFEALKGGPEGLKNTLMGLLGQTNPLLKAPLELATGKQFFTGRDLEDLYSMTGNTLTDQALMNSPLSRALTTARTLADERKWQDPLAIPLNLATGAKVTDVDMPKSRNIAERELVDSLLRGQPDVGRFTTVYPRPGAQLSPEETELLRLNRTLEQRAQQAAKQKKIRVGG